MKRVQPKFKHLWQKIVLRRSFEEPLQPFPGTALLRWAIQDAVVGTLRYEGKPSTQALRLAASFKHGASVMEFDRSGPFLSLSVFPDKSFKFNTVDWATWGRYHGEKIPEDFYRKMFKGEAGACI